MIQRDDPHLTLDEALSGPIPSGIRGMVLGSNGSSRSVKIRELSDGGFDEIHDLSVRRELPCGEEPIVHPLFWMRRHGPPVPANSPGQWGKTGQGGGASGGKGKPKRGSGHPGPSPVYSMPDNFNKGFGFGQPQLDGVEIIGGTPDRVAQQAKLARLRLQVVLQRAAAKRSKKEADTLLKGAFLRSREGDHILGAELKTQGMKAQKREERAIYQAERLVAKIGAIVSGGKRRKTSAKTARTKSDRKNAKKGKKSKNNKGEE